MHLLFTAALLMANLSPTVIFALEDSTQTETELDMSHQNLTEFDPFLYPEIQTLNVSHNQLETLDVSQNTKLDSLNCSNNQLKTLTFGQFNGLLTSLDCSYNCLTALELDALPFLGSASCNLSNQKVILPKNTTTLNLKDDLKVSLNRLKITSSKATFNPSTGELSNIQPNTTITYMYETYKDNPDLMMDVTLSFTGAEDPTLSKPEEPVIDSLPAFTGGNTPTQYDDDSIQWIAMHRLYNPNTGEHHYTEDTHERDVLSQIGWNREGIGWLAPKNAGTPVYRLYNPITEGGDHHYTMDIKERDTLRVLGWKYEDIGWYSANEKGEGVVPLYREYNPNQYSANHNYTLDRNEHITLIGLGWNDEGTAWYGKPAS